MPYGLLVWLLPGALAGCLHTTEFTCTADEDCGAGRCEDTGYCSFDDSDCAAGRRYGELSGSFAGVCVGDPVAGCPATYVALPGAPHRYRVIMSSGDWASQRDRCTSDSTSAYLAIPETMAELTALATAADASRIWVGMDDQATENTFLTVRGGSFSATDPLWDSGEPDDAAASGNGQGDCVTIHQSAMRLADDRCGTSYPAVCECEP